MNLLQVLKGVVGLLLAVGVFGVAGYGFYAWIRLAISWTRSIVGGLKAGRLNILPDADGFSWFLRFFISILAAFILGMFLMLLTGDLHTLSDNP